VEASKRQHTSTFGDLCVYISLRFDYCSSNTVSIWRFWKTTTNAREQAGIEYDEAPTRQKERAATTYNNNLLQASCQRIGMVRGMEYRVPSKRPQPSQKKQQQGRLVSSCNSSVAQLPHGTNTDPTMIRS